MLGNGKAKAKNLEGPWLESWVRSKSHEVRLPAVNIVTCLRFIAALMLCDLGLWNVARLATVIEALNQDLTSFTFRAKNVYA